MNDLIALAADEASLDNPIWNALITRHGSLAVGAGSGPGLARRYPVSIGPLSGLREQTPEAYAELARITPHGDIAVLFLEEAPDIPPGWELLRGGALVQMVCPVPPEAGDLAGEIVPLGESNFPEMVALATLTEPGPFRGQTASLGGYMGIRVEGRLAAMAGRRLSLAGFDEVSAVCTHPDFRGRGFAGELVAAVARGIYSDGRVPFLTSFATNAGAIRVYEQVGFVTRRKLELAAVRPPANSSGG